MLGRKQSVRNNEDWKNALDHIEETVSKKELDSLVKKTVKDIKEKCKGKKAAYAWSAGKDSLVLGEICEKAGIDQSVLVRCNLEYPAYRWSVLVLKIWQMIICESTRQRKKLVGIC